LISDQPSPPLIRAEFPWGANLKILCDTSALHYNTRDKPDEQAALEELAKLYPMFSSHFTRSEAGNTTKEPEKSYLTLNLTDLEPLPKHDLIVGFNLVIGRHGMIGHSILSDVQDQGILTELLKRGIKELDAKYITEAVCNDFDVFLTCDVRTIIRPHRQWLESRFPKLKIMKPSELLEFITQRSSSS
jgi:hypothetical protein